MVSTRRRTAHPGPSDKLRGAQANGSGTVVTLRPPVPGDAAGEAQTNEPRRFVRAWSEPDDLRILECLAAHVKKHRAPPARCQLLGLFAGRGLDKEEFTVTEIYEKVRRLRAQYEKMLSTPRPGQCHRRFELSKAIWGKGIAPAPAKSPDELRRRYPDLVDTVERISAAECQGRAGNALKRGLGFIDDTTAGRLNSLAKKQRCLEIKMMLKRHDLRKRVLSKRIKIID